MIIFVVVALLLFLVVGLFSAGHLLARSAAFLFRHRLLLWAALIAGLLTMAAYGQQIQADTPDVTWSMHGPVFVASTKYNPTCAMVVRTPDGIDVNLPGPGDGYSLPVLLTMQRSKNVGMRTAARLIQTEYLNHPRQKIVMLLFASPADALHTAGYFCQARADYRADEHRSHNQRPTQ